MLTISLDVVFQRFEAPARRVWVLTPPTGPVFPGVSAAPRISAWCA